MTRSTDDSEPVVVTRDLLRDWPLPAVGESKYQRGQVLVVGGARTSPGAAMLAGTAALRVGAGRLTLAVGRTAAPHVAVAIPESGVVFLDETESGSVAGASIGAAAPDLERADAVLVGPGLDDGDEAAALLERLPALVSDEATVLLDAFALGVLDRVDVTALAERLVLTPNLEEAERLLGRDLGDREADLEQIAREHRAVVSCYGFVCDGMGSRWRVGSGSGGLATSGSGDVLAGAIAGIAARGASPAQAAVWGTHLHVAAGDRLAGRIGPVGYLAHELLDELPGLLVEVGGARLE
jgi:ADP-dependent NAD(P)H-hydrate dehydratase